jgi:outer membrane receptor protein involved in Fe transport
MKYLLTYLLVVSVFQTAFSQLSGKVADAGGHPVPFAGVTLINSPDSTLVKAALTGKDGAFRIEPVEKGKYILKISSIGYQTFTSPMFELTDSLRAKDFGSITLPANSKQLSEVVIRADKPLVQQEAGGMVVNVQSSLLTKGSSALQVLQRSPGVIIDPHNNSITLNGKGGVMVMMDGKLMRMSMSQVVALLNGMSADDIDKIELLTTPPAKYDADGNAGLINIVTRKNKRPGTNGSLTASAGYGKYEKGSASINLSHNTGKISLRGSYSYYHEHGYGELFAGGTENVSAIGGQTSFHYIGLSKPVSNYQDAKTGIDVRITPKTTLGGSVYYSFGNDQNNSYNHGNYALPDSDQIFHSYLDGINHSRNMINSFYVEKEISKGEKINFDADYIYYKNEGNTAVQSSFVDNNGNPVGADDSLYSPRQRDLANTTIKVGVAKIDYIKQLSPKLKLEAGAKGTYTRSYSISGIENFVNDQWKLSTVGVSNNLGTKEAIGAAYGTFNIQVDTGANLIIGARYEYSHNSTDNASNAQYAIDRRLGKLFPSVFFTKKLTDNSDLQLSYTKRITRPSFSDLASYVTYNDPVSVFTGNPALKPTVTDNLKAAYNYHNYLFSILFSRDNDVILGTQISTGPSRGLVYLAPQNAPWQNNITFQTHIPVKITDWWESSYDFVGGLHKYKVDYTPQTFTKTYFSYSANFAETFKLPKKYSFELSGYYNSSSYYSTSRSNGNGTLNFGVKKELNNNGGSLQLSVSDLLMSASYYGYIGSLTKDAFNSQVYVRYNGESRNFPIFKLTYYRSFGTASNKSQRSTDAASKDERSRL